MLCDRNFALIEKVKRKTKLHILHDLAQMIGSVGIKNPFDVILMQGFINWKNLVDKAFLCNPDMKISEASQIELTAAKFGTIKISKSFGSKVSWYETKLLKKSKVKSDMNNRYE